MGVTVELSFKVKDQDRLYTVYMPAVLTSDDGNIETTGMILDAVTFEGLSVNIKPFEK